MISLMNIGKSMVSADADSIRKSAKASCPR